MPLLFFFYPFAEIAAWWWFISTYSFGDAVLLCFTSAVVGIWVLRLQGGLAIGEVQGSLQNGGLPPARVLHRILMSVGALLLILPGLITKTLGVAFILPGTRHFISWTLMWGLWKRFAPGFIRFGGVGPMAGFAFNQGMRSNSERSPGAGSAGDVVDVKAEVLEDERIPPRS